MIFRNIQSNFNLILGQFSVVRKLILNGGAIRPTGLLFVGGVHDMCSVKTIQQHKITKLTMILESSPSNK